MLLLLLGPGPAARAAPVAGLAAMGPGCTPAGTPQPGLMDLHATAGFGEGRAHRLQERTFRAAGAGDGSWRDGFTLPGVNGIVYKTVADGRGTLYVAGNFSVAGGVAANGLAKWDGTAWSALGTGTSGGSVSALAVDAVGNLYAGGNFTRAGGVAASGIAKWDGTVWSALGTGILIRDFEFVSQLAVDASGNVYVGGSFTQVGGVAANHLAKWNGSAWSALGTGVDYGLTALVADASGAVYAGGDFSEVGGVAARGVAKWNGRSWSALATSLTGSISTLALDNRGNLYAGGHIVQIGSATASNVAKWNGTTWSALGTGPGPGDNVYSLAADNAGNVYAAGYFFLVGSTMVNGIARWNGSSWSALGTGLDAAQAVQKGGRTLTLDGRGNVYVGGNFTTAGATAAFYIAKWDGTAWTALGTGLNDVVNAVALDASGAVYAGGSFTQAGSVAAAYIARWDGRQWSPLATGLNGPVYALVLDGSGNLYAGGSFTQAGGLAANGIAKWDGTSWSALGEGISMNRYTYVKAIATDASGNVYAGGSFTRAGGVAASNIARWNGTSWSALGVGQTGTVNTLAVAGNGNVYAGGDFTQSGGGASNYLGRWDGTAWSALGTGVNYTVNALAVTPQGIVYVGGLFYQAGGVGVNRVAKWDGTAWSALGTGVSAGPFSNTVNALLVDGGGNLFAGGSFSQAGDKTVGNVARWDGQSWSALSGTGLNGVVFALAVAKGNNQLCAGGSFTAVADGSKTTAYFGLYDYAAAPLATASAALAQAVQLYPNPSQGQATLTVPGMAGASSVRVELLDDLGRVVRSQQALLSATGTTLTLLTGGLAPGFYLVRLAAGATILTKHLHIQ